MKIESYEADDVGSWASFNGIGQEDASEEKQDAKNHEDEVAKRLYDRVMKKYPVLSRKQTIALESDPNRVNILVLHNVRLVVSIAHYYKNKGLEFNDLVGYGIIGLREAAERFDFSMGTAFSTFANWWIKQAMSSAIQKRGGIIRIPYHIYDDMGRFIKMIRGLAQKLGRYPNNEDIKKHTGMDDKSLNRMLKADKIAHPVSINDQVNGTGLTLEDIIRSPEEPTIEDVVATMMKKEAITKILDTLRPRERYVIKMLLGFYADMDKKKAIKEIRDIVTIKPICSCIKKPGKYKALKSISGCVFRDDGNAPSDINGCLLQNTFNTLEDVGKTLDLTRERIRQIESAIIKKLRHPKRRKMLEKFI